MHVVGSTDGSFAITGGFAYFSFSLEGTLCGCYLCGCGQPSDIGGSFTGRYMWGQGQ